MYLSVSPETAMSKPKGLESQVLLSQCEESTAFHRDLKKLMLRSSLMTTALNVLWPTVLTDFVYDGTEMQR